MRYGWWLLVISNLVGTDHIAEDDAAGVMWQTELELNL
jgi:hypothetical protein